MAGEFDVNVGGRNFNTTLQIGDGNCQEPIVVPGGPGGECNPPPPVTYQSRADAESSIINAALRRGNISEASNELMQCVNSMTPSELMATARLTQQKDAASGSLHDVNIHFDHDPTTGNVTAADLQVGRIAQNQNGSAILDQNGSPVFASIEADINNRNQNPNDHQAHETVYSDPSNRNADCAGGPYQPTVPCEPGAVIVPEQPGISFNLNFGRFFDGDRDGHRDGHPNGNNIQQRVIVEHKVNNTTDVRSKHPYHK